MDPESPIQRFADIVIAGGLALLGLAVALGDRFGPSDPETAAAALRGAVAILSMAAAVMWLLLRMTRRDLRRMDALLDDVRFGAGTKRDKDAVDILVKALRTPDPHVQETARRTLRKITGRDLGKDPGDWEAWWATARATFTRAPAAAPEKK